MEFIINTDLEKSLPAVIDFNFEEMKSELAERLQHYKSIVVTEDSIKSGKEDRTKLNRLEKAIDDKRKEIKKQCLAPYEGFECKCKELCGMISEASTVLDTQIKAFDNAEKEERRKSLEHFYQTNIKSLIDLLPLEKIWSDKWLNKGVTLEAAQKELIEVINKAHNDVEVIRAMHLECEAVVLDAYLNKLDMSAALAEKNRFEERQKQLAELSTRTAPATAVPQNNNEYEIIAPKPLRTYQTSAEDAKTTSVIFYDTTAAFRQDMKALAEKHHIRYGGIK